MSPEKDREFLPDRPADTALTPDERRLILEKRARDLARPPALAEADSRVSDWIVFSSGAQLLGIPISFSLEIFPVSWVTRVPCTPDFVKGVVNFRGRLVPLLDLGRFLGLPRQEAGPSSFAVLVRCDDPDSRERLEVAILAEGLPTVRSVPESAARPADGLVSGRLLEFTTGITEDMLALLNLKGVLCSPELIIHDEAS